MSNLEIKRDHEGVLHLFVAGQPANGVRHTIMQVVEGEMTAFFAVPLRLVTLGEVTNVIPFTPAARSG